MKVAIIGSSLPDSLEYNLQEAFTYRHDNCQIFDIVNTSVHTNKYLFNIEKLLRNFSNKYDTNIFKKLAEKVAYFKPDLVICVYRFIHPIFITTIKKFLKSPVIHINPDALTTFEYQQVFASDYDAWFSKDPYIVRFMRNNMHLNAIYYNEAFNKRLHRKPEIEKAKAEEETCTDIMTYGTIYPYRSNMLKQVIKAGLQLKIYGSAPHRFYDHTLDRYFQNKYIAGKEKAKLLYGSKIVFNQMHYAEIESVNNRFFETNGCGAFQISDYRPILNEILPIDPEKVSFKTIDDAIDKMKYYLDNPQERYEIAQTIYEHFVKKYSYDELINYILNKI